MQHPHNPVDLTVRNMAKKKSKKKKGGM